MKLNRFKTEYSFDKWFSKNRDKFQFTEMNMRIAEDPVEICRLTDKNRTVGLVLYNQFDTDNMYIATFEIQEKYRGQGYGRKMFDMLMKEAKPKWVLLDFCEGDKDSFMFWKSMGFHRRKKYAMTNTEMYKDIKRKERYDKA